MKQTRLTVAARQQIAMKAAKSKYKAAFDDTKKLFAKSARDYVVENSLHKEALLCSEDLRMMIPKTHSITFPRVYFEKVTASIFDFSGGATSVGYMHLHDMVYASKIEKVGSDFPAYIEYKKIILEAEKFYFELLLVLNSYKTLESAAKQLPWLTDFVPTINESSTSLVDIKQVERINDLMKGVKQ